jgi:hypothetical protein
MDERSLDGWAREEAAPQCEAAADWQLLCIADHRTEADTVRELTDSCKEVTEAV